MTNQAVFFDFDGTLFHSLRKPVWWPQTSFHERLEMLSPPYIPEAPNPEWYIKIVLEAALDATADSSTYTCVVAGRPKEHAARVRQLLDNAGVWFDEYLMAGSTETLPCRIEAIRRLAARFPELHTIEMWSGVIADLEVVQRTVESMRLKAILHHVRSRPPQILKAR